MEAARAQLRRYAGDARVREHLGPAHLHALVLLYSGWELVQREALDLAAEVPQTKDSEEPPGPEPMSGVVTPHTDRLPEVAMDLSTQIGIDDDLDQS
jgi:hypothetical protein